MKIWTVHTPEVWEALQASPDGRLHADIARTNYPEARFAYDWMREQMQKRIPGYGLDYPWWGLLSPNFPTRIKYPQYEQEPKEHLVLEMDLEEGSFLVSDLRMWSCGVFQDTYVSWDEEDHVDACSYLSGLRLTNPDEYQAAKRASWERIFDYENPLLDRCWYSPVQTFQATFAPLELAKVVRVFRPDTDKEIYHR